MCIGDGREGLAESDTDRLGVSEPRPPPLFPGRGRFGDGPLKLEAMLSVASSCTGMSRTGITRKVEILTN